jgi:hypothetical protein
VLDDQPIDTEAHGMRCDGCGVEFRPGDPVLTIHAGEWGDLPSVDRQRVATVHNWNCLIMFRDMSRSEST